MIYLETFYMEITMLFCIRIYIYMTRILINYNSWIFSWMTHWDLMLIGFPRSI